MTPRVTRYSYLFAVEYRTAKRLGCRNVYVVAETEGEAAHKVLEKAHGWRGVVKVDRARMLGRPIQCSGE